MFDLEAAAADVIDVSPRLHRDLGPGLLESVYEAVLAAKLRGMGYRVERQRSIAIKFEGLRFDGAFKADLVVGGTRLVEIKSMVRLSAVHAKQLLTYLRLIRQPLGLLITFGGATLEEGIRRLVNGYYPLASSRLCANRIIGE